MRNAIEETMKTLKEEWPTNSKLKNVVIKKRYGPSEIIVHATISDIVKYKDVAKQFAHQSEMIMIQELNDAIKVFDDTDQLLLEKKVKK